MRVVHGRWPGAFAALVGVLLALPSLTAATWEQAVVARDRGEVVVRELVYSWGRSDLVGAGGTTSTPAGNGLALAAFVALLLVAAGVALAWLVLPRRLALLAPAGVALLAGRLVGTVTERHGRSFAPGTQRVPGLDYVTGSTAAGWAETASLVVLGIAVGVMGATLLTWRPPDASVDPAANAAADHAEGVPDPANGPSSPRRHLDAPPVAFSDPADGRATWSGTGPAR